MEYSRDDDQEFIALYYKQGDCTLLWVSHRKNLRNKRKWVSTHLIANRLPVNAVQDRLGHSRPRHCFDSPRATAG